MQRLGRILGVVMAAGLLGVQAPVAISAQSGTIAFRDACHLADAAAVSAALGVDVVANDSLSPLVCDYRQGDQVVAEYILRTDLFLPLVRLAFPDITDTTVAGQAGVSSPGDGNSLPPTVAVALPDGGLLLAQVMTGGAIPDPEAKAGPFAELAFAAGPVTAHQPAEPTGSSLTYGGAPCDALTTKELKGITGETFEDPAPDTTGVGCTFQTAPGKGSLYVTYSLNDGTLSALRSGKAVSLKVGDRAALYRPDMFTLSVDAGGGKLLQVTELSIAGQTKKDRERVQDHATRIAKLVVGRMVSDAASPSPSTPPTCALVAADTVLSITGVTFVQVSPDGTDVCYFVTTDQRTSVLLAVSDAASLEAAWTADRTMFGGLPDPTEATVAGHPASTADTTKGAIVVVDLAGIAGRNGKVLTVIADGFPAGTDELAIATKVAEATLAGM